jgi:hypothetical protein
LLLWAVSLILTARQGYIVYTWYEVHPAERLKLGRKGDRLIALQELRQDRNAFESILPAVTDKDSEVRRQGIESLSQMRDPRVLDVLLAAATADTDERARSVAAYSLGEVDDPRRVSYLIRVLTSKSSDKLAASNALEKIGRPALELLLQERSGCCERTVINIMSRIGENERKSVLEAYFKDTGLVFERYTFLLYGRWACMEQHLVKALAAHGNTEMARAFLNSGNRVLYKAAADWGRARGMGVAHYTTVTIKGGEVRSWGGHE